MKEAHWQFYMGSKTWQLVTNVYYKWGTGRLRLENAQKNILKTHVPSGYRINYRSKTNYIHILPSIFCFPQPVLIFHFLPDVAALSWSNNMSRVLTHLVAALNLSVPRKFMIWLRRCGHQRHRSHCVLLPVYVHSMGIAFL